MTGEPRLRFHLGTEGAVWYQRSRRANHVLIDPQARSRALAPGFVRPIELWRSPRWDRPASAAVVRYQDAAPAPAPAPAEAPGARPAVLGGGSYGYGFGPGTPASGLTFRPGYGFTPGAPGGARSGPATLPQNDTGAADEPPALGDVVNRASVVDFVGDVSAFRLGALGALIDAVAAALDGGLPVVLACSDPDEAAMWIGAVSFFAPPAVCLQLSFSTHERWDDVLAQLKLDEKADRREPDEPGDAWRMPVITAVPREDLRGLTRRDELPVVVVDPHVEATLAAAGGTEHRETHLGQRITVTDWSRLALDACCEDFTVLEKCLSRLDVVSQAGHADPGAAARPDGWWPAEPPRTEGPQRPSAPAWTLAAAVALTGDLPLALPTATRVLLRDTPRAARLPDELAGRVSSLVSATVDDAEQAWARLTSALTARPVMGALVHAAFESYLRLALADESWLLREPAPLPEADAVRPIDPGLSGRLTGPLSAVVDRLSGQPDGVRLGVLMLRVMDLAERTGRLIRGDIAPAGLARLAVRAAAMLLDGDTGERIAQIAGPLDGAAVARWILPPFDRDPRWQTSGAPVGERLPAPVIALLAGGVDAAGLDAVPRAEGLVAEPVALEVAVAAATGRIAGDGRLRRPAVEYLLHQAAAAYPDADPGAIVDDIFARLDDGDPWPAAALLRLVQDAPSALGSHLVPVALSHLPGWIDDRESGRLAAALLKRVEFLPRRGGDGEMRPRRAGTRDDEAQLLNLLATTGDGWLQLDDGLHRRAAEILMWADRAWEGADDEVRQLIAPRITVAAFQVALAAEPAQARTPLRSRLGVVPIGAAWRSAIPLGLEPALPMVSVVLGLNRYRLAGELTLASTRAMLTPQVLGDLPRLPVLPVGPVLRRLVTDEPTGRLREHLAALVDQELREHDGPVDAERLLAFWSRALPGATIAAQQRAEELQQDRYASALEVALGVNQAPGRPGGLAQLLSGRRRNRDEPERDERTGRTEPTERTERTEGTRSARPGGTSTRPPAPDAAPVPARRWDPFEDETEPAAEPDGGRSLMTTGHADSTPIDPVPPAEPAEPAEPARPHRFHLDVPHPHSLGFDSVVPHHVAEAVRSGGRRGGRLAGLLHGWLGRGRPSR